MMPAKHKRGRGRLDLKYPAPFIDMLADAAEEKVFVPLSQLIRDALVRELERLGYRSADIHDALRPQPKPRRRRKP